MNARGLGVVIALYGVYLEANNLRNPLTGAVLTGEDGRPYVVAGLALYFLGGR